MRKSLTLLWEDVRAYATGRAEVRRARWERDPWLYPTDWSALLPIVDAYFGPFDGDGVPLQPVGDARHYNPSRIAGYALLLWNEGGAQDARRSRFLACADWFLRARDARFAYSFDAGGMRAPWLSCIAQGQAISVLVRAFRTTGDERYLEQAGRAVAALAQPVAEGGLLDRLADGGEFLEEYPGRYPHVLNGCLHALVGLDDLARARGEAPHALFGAVLATTARNVACWDVGGWSTYDLQPAGRSPNLATLNYHLLHCIFLRYLAERASAPALAAIASRWESTAARPARRLRALGGKVRYRIAEGW
jgi:hypothetical protein